MDDIFQPYHVVHISDVDAADLPEYAQEDDVVWLISSHPGRACCLVPVGFEADGKDEADIITGLLNSAYAHGFHNGAEFAHQGDARLVRVLH